MKARQQPDRACRERGSKRDLPEDCPKKEKQHRISEEADQQSKRDLHLRIGFKLVLDQSCAEDADDVYRKMDEHRDEEEWKSNEAGEGVLDEDTDGGESGRKRSFASRVEGLGQGEVGECFVG